MIERVKRTLNLKEKTCVVCGGAFQPRSGAQARCEACKAAGKPNPAPKVRKRKDSPPKEPRPTEVAADVEPAASPRRQLEIALAEMTPPAERDMREAAGTGSSRRRSRPTRNTLPDFEPLDLSPLQAYIQRVVSQAIDERLRAIFAKLGAP